MTDSKFVEQVRSGKVRCQREGVRRLATDCSPLQTVELANGAHHALDKEHMLATLGRTRLQARHGVGVAAAAGDDENPVACAAGLAVLEVIREERLVENAAARGAELRAGLGRIAAEDDRVGDVRGPGLMVGVELVRSRDGREPDGDLADRVMAACADAGLLVLLCGRQHQVVRWIPPLNVTAAEIAEGVEIFGESLASIPRD